MKKLGVFIKSVAVVAPMIVFADVSTGWKTPLATGTYQWESAENWVEGVPNGIFSADLIGSGKTAPTVTFSADTTLPTGLSLLYQNAEQTLTFRGEGGDRMLTVGGPLDISPTVGTKGGIVFGSATANQNLNLNLNGDRTLTLGSAMGPTFYGTISGGALTVTGPDTINGILTLAGNGSIASNVFFTTGHGLSISEKGLAVPGCERAKGVRLESGYLVYEGTKTGTNATKDSLGRLILAPGQKGGGLVRFLNWGDSTYNGAHLKIGEIVREQETMLDIHSVNGILGKDVIGSKGVVSVTADKGVTALGPGGAGTPQVPVVPWARGSIPTKDQLAGDTWVTHLITYEADRGFRFLDAATEYDTYAEAYTGPVREPNGNVRVTGENVVFTGNNTVNSLSTLTSSAVTITADDGTMKILSGVLDLSVGNNATVTGNFDFGEQTAYITHCSGKSGNLHGTITARDVVFGSQALRSATTGSQLGVDATGNISGDVYVNGGLSIGTDKFLPHGDKKGRTIVNGTLRLFTTQVTLNGLSGSGRITYGQSYAANLTFGDNDADGEFTGTVERTGGTLRLTKTGKGAQYFGNTVTINSELNVQGGTASFDGNVAASDVRVSSAATLAGSGAFEALVTLEDGVKLKAGSLKSDDDQVMNLNGGLTLKGAATLDLVAKDKLTVGGVAVKGALTIPEDKVVTVNVLLAKDAKGNAVKLKGPAQHVVFAAESPLTLANFKRGTNCGPLTLSQDGTQLLMAVQNGFAVIVK